MKVIVVVDVQNDFTTGVLGTPEAVATIPNIVNHLSESTMMGDAVIFTRDTHNDNYMDTQEGKKLPVPHCLKHTDGWRVVKEVADATPFGVNEDYYIDKPTFGSFELVNLIQKFDNSVGVDEIEMFGFCTDICVISNALILKNAFPNTEINVVANCCAGVTPKSHINALEAMKMCQINII